MGLVESETMAKFERIEEMTELASRRFSRPSGWHKVPWRNLNSDTAYSLRDLRVLCG